MFKESVTSKSIYGGSYSSGITGSGGGIQPGVLLAVGAVALIAAILLFILVIKRKKSFKGKFANWMKEYLNFRSVLIAGIIKFLYVFLAVFLTIMSFVIMFQGKGDDVLPMILTGLASLTLGNILLRAMVELTMAIIVVWENTSDIRLLLIKRGGSAEVAEAPAEIEQPEASQPEPTQYQASETPDVPKGA